MHDHDDHTETVIPVVANAEQLQTVLDSAFEAVISIDLDGRVVIWNDQAERMFGWCKDEVEGVGLVEAIIPQEMLEAYRARLKQCRELEGSSATLRPIEAEVRDRTGRTFPVEMSINAVRIEKGAAGFTIFIRDLRPARERQRKLEVSDERLQRVLEGADQGFWDIYLHGAGSALSSRCSTMLGYESGAVANGPPDEAQELHPEDYAHVHDAWQLCQQPASIGLEVVYRLKAADGSWRWVSDVGEVVDRDTNGKPTRIVGTRTDITDRNALEESLRASQKLECLGSVASGFAHDLNNILAAISGHASLATNQDAVPPKLAESLGVIQLAVTRARVLTENMLALGRPGEVVESEVGIRDCIESTCALLRPSFPRSIKVLVNSSLPSGARARVDAGQFQQSIINLLLNARDAIEQEGRIEVAIEGFGEDSLPWARIAVSDTGSGISAADQEHIFKPFFTTKKPGEGTGIGLAVVDAFVESARGRVEVHSVVGTGTTFQMELPLVLQAERVTSSEEGECSQGACQVLLVEDHSMLRPMLAEAIAAGGHYVSSFESVAGVLESELIQEDKVDVCVIDVNLGDGNGVELAAQIEATLGRPVPTVFSTGNPDSVGIRHLKPWQSLLRKPFEIDALMHMIRTLAVMSKATS